MSEDSRESKAPSSEPPEFMRKIPDEFWANQMEEDPDYYVNLAYFSGNNTDTPERMLLFQAAGDLLRAQERAEVKNASGAGRSNKRPTALANRAEWDFEVRNTYPEEPLPASEKTNTASRDVPPRAVYLYEALRQLLLLVDAPDAMICDLKTLLGVGAHAAAKRAAVQAAMIAHPDWSETKIAKELEFNQTRMVKEIEAGKLRDFRELRKMRSSPDKP